MTEDDLKAIEEWERAGTGLFDGDRSKVRALIAEVRQLRPALEAIIYASDQCRGHRDCGHSMEPWEKARALLGLTAG